MARLSHYDALDLGNRSQGATPDYAIRTPEQAEQLRALIGNENVEATKRALADGALVWVFRTEAEIDACSALHPEEKQTCYANLRSTDGRFAGFFRLPERINPGAIALGAAPSVVQGGHYDPHGNFRVNPSAKAKAGTH